MLLPVGDDNRDRNLTPVVNYLLIALNVFVFIYYQRWGMDTGFTFAYATVPAEILSGRDVITESRMMQDPYTGQQFELPGLGLTPVPVFLTLITSMFMHGGLAHLLGNMLYLWIFGDNIESSLGHRNYLLFYLLGGLIASLSHVFTTAFLGQNMLIPSLGASGAIAAVLGAYLMMHPRRGVHIWIFLFVITLPAFLVVGLWFVFQIINGMGALGGTEAGGVAYAAHIGGFIAGFILIRFFKKRPQPVRQRQRRRLF